MKIITTFCLIWLFAVSAGHATTLDLNLPITTDPTPTQFLIPSRINPGQIDGIGYQLLGTSTPFDADVSNFDRIIWEVNAPAGQRWQVDAPQQIGMRMSYDFRGDDTGSFTQNPEPIITVEFIGLIGPVPTNSVTTSSFRADGDQISSTWAGTVNTPFSFEGVRLIANGPFESNGSYTFTENFVSPVLRFSTSGPSLPIEPFFTLVPEPTSLALLGLGGLLLARRRRI